MYDWTSLLARAERRAATWRERVTSKGLPVPPDLQRSPACAPATLEQIAAGEKRLRTRLPPSLRSFYLTSNGFGVVGSFIWGVPPIERVGWIRDLEPQFCAMLRATFASSKTLGIPHDLSVGVVRSLLLSTKGDASYWVLDPGSRNAAGEWRAGRWSSWNPGIAWIADNFYTLFEREVASAEEHLTLPSR
jgi:hypothetical protein